MAKKTDKENGTPGTLHVSVLLDESGSMGGLEEAVTTGFNDFIAELREGEAKSPTRVSLAMFDLSGNDSVTRVKVDSVPLDEITDITAEDYRPRGATPLNDAVVSSIRRLEAKLGKNDRAIMVVLTDGLENASETSSNDLRELVLAKEKAGWEFIYLGANQDSWAESRKVAMAKAGGSFNWEASSQGVSDALLISADRVASFRDRPGEYLAEGQDLGVEAREARRRRNQRKRRRR